MTPYESIKASALVTLLVLVAWIASATDHALDSVALAAQHAAVTADRTERDAKLQTAELVRIVNSRAMDALALIEQTREDANTRTGEALELARQTAAVADQRLGSIETVVDLELGRANRTLRIAADELAGPDGSVTLALARYRVLPDEISRDPVFRAYEAQGLGTLAATKVFMGDAAKAGRTFDAQFPALLGNFSATTQDFAGISKDVHVFTSRAIAPRGFWGNVKDVITTGSGVTRAAAAAGVF